MPDDLEKKGPPDGKRINVHEAWELRDWSKHFGITEQQLRDAVKAVGPMTADVKRHLGNNGLLPAVAGPPARHGGSIKAEASFLYAPY